jgi:hypothetical protein
MKIRQDIMYYIRANKTFTIPQLQSRFSLSYYEAHNIVKTLLANKYIYFAGGLNYAVGKKPDEDEGKPKRKPVFDWGFGNSDDDEEEDDDDDCSWLNDDDDEEEDEEDNDDDEREGKDKIKAKFEELEKRRKQLEEKRKAVVTQRQMSLIESFLDVNGKFASTDLPENCIDMRLIDNCENLVIKYDGNEMRKDAIAHVQAILKKSNESGFFNAAQFFQKVLLLLYELNDRRYKTLRNLLL